MSDKGLSQQRVAHALRHFVLCGALWSIYGPNATAAGAIFSGFALHVGLKEAQIAFLVSLSSLAGVSQLVSFYLTRRVRNRRRFMVLLGQVEITAASCIVLMGLVAPEYRFAGVAVLLVMAYLIGHTVSPLFNSWLSNVIPEEERATYTGRRMFILTVTSMVYLYLASAWVDRVPGLRGFGAVFAVGWIAGLMGYWLLLSTPLPTIELPPGRSFRKSLLEPWRDRGFATLALFFSSWTMAMQLAGAFYGIYMINYLHLSYSRIAIYTNLTLLLMVVGYLGMGQLAQRYGSKPLARILILPATMAPLLWALTTEANYETLVPIACVINGIAISGLSVAASSLLYKVVPKGVDNSPYFANWTGLWAFASALGPFVGGALRTWLPGHIMFGGLELSSLQVIFGISAALFVVPLVISVLLVEAEATSPAYLLGQFRGNLLSFAYNMALYHVARADERRAQAVRGLGRSRTPLAVDPLLHALGHMSHDVRSEAARGLGDGQFPEAVTPLVNALEDEGSDIRPEAAEALGKIGDRSAAGPLLKALGNPDIRLRTSAVLALGAINDEQAAAALYEAISGPFDRGLFPTLVEAATRRSDLRLVEPIMQRLSLIEQPVLRMQVLNGVCRVLGEKNHFYRLANAGGLQRAALVAPMMQRITRLLSRAEHLDGAQRQQMRSLAKEAGEALENDETGRFALAARAIAENARGFIAAPDIARHAAQALIQYLDAGRADRLKSEGVVMLVIALTALSRSLAGKHQQDPRGDPRR